MSSSELAPVAIGARFGKLLIVGGPVRCGRDRGWECLCDCGRTLVRRTNNITRRGGGVRGCEACTAISRREWAARGLATHVAKSERAARANAQLVSHRFGDAVVVAVVDAPRAHKQRCVVRFEPCGHVSDRPRSLTRVMRGRVRCNVCSTVQKRARFVDVNGLMLPIADVARLVGCDEKLIRYRIKKGLTGAALLRAPRVPGPPRVPNLSKASHRARPRP